MRYKAIFEIPDGWLIGCASAKIRPDDGRIRTDKQYKDVYADTIPDDSAEQEAKKYCAECNHIEMCRWYPYDGCEFRDLPKRKKRSKNL